MILPLSSDLEQAISDQSRRLGTTPENIVLNILRRQLMPETPHSSVSLQQERRMSALAKIRSGKYARREAPDTPLPSERFAARKEEEKKLEERHRK